MISYSIALKLVFAAALACPAAFAQTEPGAGQWKTWVIPSASSLRVPPPPDSAGETAALRAIMAGSDPTSARVAFWDAGAPGYRWMQITTQELLTRNTAAPLATAAAAATALAYLFPDKADAFNVMAKEAENSRLVAGVEFPSDSAAGVQLGGQVGAEAVAGAKSDGSDAVFTGSFPAAPGKWGSANPVQPLAGNWMPWVLTSGAQIRPDPPPAFDSPEMSNQLALVKNLMRTNEINHTAWFWQPSFFGPWVETIHQKIFEYHLEANAPRAARVYALTMIAQHDATIACWDAKYTYLEPRPIMFDPTISTVFATPAHPSFPSGHACASGGIEPVLQYLFPADSPSFSAQAVAAGVSTFDAGIHFPNDVDAGLALGRNAGQAVVNAAKGDGAQ